MDWEPQGKQHLWDEGCDYSPCEVQSVKYFLSKRVQVHYDCNSELPWLSHKSFHKTVQSGLSILWEFKESKKKVALISPIVSQDGEGALALSAHPLVKPMDPGGLFQRGQEKKE